MRLSFLLIPILVVLGLAGCVVHPAPYGTAYVAYGDPYYDGVYFSDGYYWAYYNDGWYWWSRDRWVYSYARPRTPVYVRSTPWGYHGPGGYAHGKVVVRDHRPTTYHSAPARSAPGYSAPVRSAPVRSAPVRSAPVVRDHRR